MGKFRTGRGGRLMTLGGMAVRLGGNAIGSAAKRLSSGKNAAQEALHRKTAERLFETMAEMKGLPMKVGQLLSFMDGVVPPDYQDIYADLLSRLQTKAEPWPWAPMKEQLEAGLGTTLDEAFSTFDQEPHAAASIGQVYKAELASTPGRLVAVKVQYPDIDRALRSDLRNAGQIARTLHSILPNVQSRVMVQDFLDRLGEECDYRHELENQQSFVRAWQDDPQVLIPEAISDLSSERVLVSDWMEGESFEAVTTWEAAHRHAVGATLFRFAFRSILVHGMFNADPHPGNFLFSREQGTVVFLDFGCVQRFDAQARENFAVLIRAIVDGARGDALWPVLETTLEFPSDASAPLRAIIENYVMFCFEPIVAPQPYRYTREYTTRLSELTMQAKMTVAKNLLRIGWREPKREGLVMLSRILFGLNSLLAALEAEADWRAILLEILAEAHQSSTALERR